MLYVHRMSSKIIFSSRDDKVLSELVGKHPCLYDSKHPSYKDQLIRGNVWKQISNELNRPVDDCKKRWKNIKDTYNKKRRGRNLGTKEKPSKWILEDLLSFMDTAAICKKQSINNVAIEEETFICNEEDNVSSDDNSVSTQMEPVIENLPSAANFEPTAVTEMFEIEATRKKRQKKTEAFIEVLNKRCEEGNHLFHEITKTEEEDTIDVFFKSMALTVKQFSPELKIKAKMEVFKIINEFEFQNLKLNGS